jgi:hypothetical protein
MYIYKPSIPAVDITYHPPLKVMGLVLTIKDQDQERGGAAYLIPKAQINIKKIDIAAPVSVILMPTGASKIMICRSSQFVSVANIQGDIHLFSFSMSKDGEHVSVKSMRVLSLLKIHKGK